MFLCSYKKQTIPLTEASIDNIKVKPEKKIEDDSDTRNMSVYTYTCIFQMYRYDYVCIPYF